MLSNSITANRNLITCQTTFLDYLAQVKSQTTSVELADNGLSALTQQIAEAELIVPVVGGFSAGIKYTY